MKKISKNQIKEFNDNGFLIIKDIIDISKLKKINSIYKKIFNGHYQTEIVPDKVKWKPNRDSLSIPRSLCNVWKSNKNIAQVVCSKTISSIAGQLMNWNSVRLNQDSLIWLVPKAGCVNFHQDNPYQDWHTPGNVITCWIPVTKTNINSGSIEYLVGSNKKKISKRLKNFYSKSNYRSIINKYLKKDESKIKTMSLDAGSVVFHHGNTWHGSGYNQTSKDRISISIHFMDGKSKFHPKIKSPFFNHYKKFDSLAMEESFFPITWSKKKNKIRFIDKYLIKS